MQLPLAGVRVLDLTQALAGPTGSMILGDLGAEVIKVEPRTGDLTRTSPPHYVEGDSVYFLSINRNKLGVVLDLKHPEGLSTFYELARVSDVVFYNYRPGVVERLRIDHETLIGINPRLITCNVTGFGRRGPEADRRAVDLIVQAMAGGMSITGEPGRPPVRAGVPTADLATGLYAVIGILAALHARNATGRGLKVETSLFHSQLSLLSYVAAYCLFSGEIPPPLGSGHLGTVPSQVFRTKDSYIAVDAGFNHHFAGLCAALGLPELATDPRFIDRPRRNQHRHQLIALLAQAFEHRTTLEWMRELDGRGIPCGPVHNVAEALSSVQSTEYQAVKNVVYKGHEVKVLGTPLWFNDSVFHPVGPPPALGEHTAQVLSRVLGYEPERITMLAQSGAISFNTSSGEV